MTALPLKIVALMTCSFASAHCTTELAWCARRAASAASGKQQALVAFGLQNSYGVEELTRSQQVGSRSRGGLGPAWIEGRLRSQCLCDLRRTWRRKNLSETTVTWWYMSDHARSAWTPSTLKRVCLLVAGLSQGSAQVESAALQLSQPCRSRSDQGRVEATNHFTPGQLTKRRHRLTDGKRGAFTQHKPLWSDGPPVRLLRGPMNGAWGKDVLAAGA